MSISIMSAVWDRGPTDKAELLLLLALSDYANDVGECWPSIDSLTRKSRLSERGVQTVMRRLQDAGWVEIEVCNGRNNTNLYRVINPAPAAPRSTCPPQPDAETPQPDAINPAPAAPKPSRTIKNHQGSNARDALLSVLSEEIADAFISHRKAKRSKLTDHAAVLIAKKLAGHPNPDAVVEKSIMNGWTGVFPDETEKKSNGGRNEPANKSRERMAAFIAGARGTP